MMNRILARLKRLFGKETEPGMSAKSMLEMLAVTQDLELTCDEVHALIDQFAEMQQRGEDPAHFFPLVQQHLDMCPDCREEYEALLTAIQISLE